MQKLHAEAAKSTVHITLTVDVKTIKKDLLLVGYLSHDDIMKIYPSASLWISNIILILR